MATTLYLVVSGNGTKEEVARYMYATSTPVKEYDLNSVRRVCSIWQITSDKSETAEYLAKYQVGRLESGMFVGSIFESLANARDWAEKVSENRS